MAKSRFSRRKEDLEARSMVNRCWDLIFIKLDWKPKFSSKPILDVPLSLDLISCQIRLFNPRDQFKSYIQFILNFLLMIHTMQLFNFFKSSFKNLMNLPSLHIQDNLKRKIPKIQLINQLDQITFAIQAHFSNSP